MKFIKAKQYFCCEMDFQEIKVFLSQAESPVIHFIRSVTKRKEKKKHKAGRT